MQVSMTVNGQQRSDEVEPRLLLVGEEAERHRRSHAVDDEGVTDPLAMRDMRRPLAERRTPA